MNRFTEKQLLKIERMRELSKDIIFSSENIILDVGCGDKPLSKEIVKDCIMGKKHIIGLDIQIESLKKARESGIETILGDFSKNIPFKNETFDLVIAAGYIPSLIYDTDYFLEEIRRVLKSSGYLLTDVANICSIYSRLRVIVGYMPLCIEYAKETIDGNARSGIIRAYNKDIFIALIKKHHFDVENTKTDMIVIPKLITLSWKFNFLTKFGESIICKCKKKR